MRALPPGDRQLALEAEELAHFKVVAGTRHRLPKGALTAASLAFCRLAPSR